jgi:diguanylate cyclase (GGDEF)-like protein
MGRKAGKDSIALEKRRFTRQTISLSALMHPPKGRSWLCHVRDFCEDGMLLTGSRGHRIDNESINAGDEVALHFSVASPEGQHHFRTQAKIIRILDGGAGIGVQFPSGVPDEAYDSLKAFSIAAGLSADPSADIDGIGEADDDAAVASAYSSDQLQGAENIELYEATPPGSRLTEDGRDPQPGAPGAASGRQPAGKAPGPASGPALDKASGKGPSIARAAGKAGSMRDRRVSESQAEAVRKRVLEVTRRALQRLGSQYTAAVQETLLLRARDAETNTLQQVFFEGLDALEKHDQSLRDGMVEGVLGQIRAVSDLEKVMERRRRRQSGNTAKLELVDTEDFEEWLGIAEIISKAENRYTNELLDLRAQLGLIAKPWSHKDVVPVGPSAISWSFDDALKPLGLRRQVRETFFEVFSKVLVKSLGNLYIALNQVLEESGAFPSLEKLRDDLTRGQIKRTTSGVKVDTAAYKEMDSAVREAAMAADGVVSKRVDYNPFEPVAGPKRAANTARNMLGINRQARELLGRPRDEMLATADAASHELFDSQEILDALASLQSELGDSQLSDQRLKPRLMETLRRQHGDKSFSESSYDTIDVMENLVDSIESDRLITDGIREWVKRLELTLHKLATRDPSFLESDPTSPHGAVRMLNQLARLGNAKDSQVGIDREVGRQVDELLGRVIGEYDQNPEIFDEVVDELNPLIDRQTKAYRGNIERTVRASEGQQKLARARLEVLQSLEDTLEGEELPDLLTSLLNPGWRNLLVHTHLRHGQDSNEWRDAVSVVDQLKGQLTGKISEADDEFVPTETLLKRVVDGLNSISFDPAKRTPLIMKLSSALVGDAEGRKVPVTTSAVPAGGAVDVLGLDGLLPEVAPVVEQADAAGEQSWQDAVSRARRVQVGEWLATSDARGRPLILSVAYVGDDNTSFVLVNRKGVKARELTLKDLAEGLQQGHITLLDDYDLPLMERASQRMLENMHTQLAHQASHDDLTELLNRKEFERQLEDAIKSARQRELQHALLYVDLDQFKIINNTSGHSAGDALLKQIGDCLSRTFKEQSGAQLSRLGGDEFGVLLPDIDTDDARKLCEALLQSIRDERFEWEGKQYTVSASMGLVFVDSSTESADVALRHADEACYSAKDAGRNRLQEYELNDTRMLQRHGIMEWVTQLDKALDEERLVLNCQRIAPLGGTANSGPCHYEILLTMRDELGDMMPPTDFILAAETYNRMATVDRWVIDRVLSWMADHRAGLDHCAGMSINVSGHSVNDETFADFVLEAFARTQAPTGKVCFEITETAAIANLDNAIDFMNRMKIIGCQFSLDDFGTGLSSYSYLRNLPVDYVKIDGVFVRGIADNPGDFAVVKSINEIGHYMGKRTIAEFVENKAVLDKLGEIGVDFGQGWEIDRPQLLEDLKL